MSAYHLRKSAHYDSEFQQKATPPRMLKNKCVFVIGPESSGSKLVAKICSHVLGIHEFGHWDGTAWSNKGEHAVLHRSLPYQNPSIFPDLNQWVDNKRAEYDISFILTTRDISMSHLSRYERWEKQTETSERETETARAMMVEILNGPEKSLLWSYETFMFLKMDYLKTLYDFLEVSSKFKPELIDGNRKKVKHLTKTTSVN